VTWKMLLIVVGLQQCIAAEFVLQLPKMSSIQCRSSIAGRNGPGGS
jgi:hypothetical protein